jgi:hypothetical protein
MRRIEVALELELLENRAREHPYLKWRQRELEAECLRLHATRQLRLARLPLSKPCAAVSWESMKSLGGDAHAKQCGRCGNAIYKLSAMSPEMVGTLMGHQPKARFVRREDNTIMVYCPMRARTRRALTWVTIIMLSIGIITCDLYYSTWVAWGTGDGSCTINGLGMKRCTTHDTRIFRE